MARTRSASLMSGPRDVLMRKAVGFINERVEQATIPAVASGQDVSIRGAKRTTWIERDVHEARTRWIEMTSEVSNNSSLPAMNLMPSASQRSLVRLGDHAWTSIPNALPN